MTNLPCSPAIHAALAADPAAFARHRRVGFRFAPDGDVLELRSCTTCSAELARPLGIVARLAACRTAPGLVGDQSMIGRCTRALSAVGGQVDEGAVASWCEAVAFEALIPRARTVTVAGGPDYGGAR